MRCFQKRKYSMGRGMNKQEKKLNVDSYIKECKGNGFTLKEMELLSEVFSERIRAEVERAKYVVTV